MLSIAAANAASVPAENTTTAKFLASCDANPKSVATQSGPCSDSIFYVSAALIVTNAVCLSDADMSDQAQARQLRQILGWLKTHPELAGSPYRQAISAAWKATYPCRK